MQDNPVEGSLRMQSVQKPWLTATSRLLLFVGWGVLVLYVGKLLSKPLFDPDLYWHLAAGREMVENSRFLRTDVFSFPYFGKPWINSEWLFEVGAYLLEKFLGMAGIFWFKIIFSSMILIVMGGAIRKAGARGGWLFLLSVLGVLLVQFRLSERAELITFLFLGLELLFLLSAQNQPTRSFPWIMAGIVAVWVNVHGGVVYGLGLLALFNLGARGSRADPAFVKALNQALLLSGAAFFLNPYGWRLLSFYWDVLVQAHGPLHNVIDEWQRPTIHKAPFYWIVFVMAGFILVDGYVGDKKKTIFWIPATLLFAVWTSLHIRSTALYAFVALPMAAGWRTAFWKGRGPLWHGLCVAAGIGLLLNSPIKIRRDPPDASWVPSRACSFVQKMDLSGQMYNSYKFGGYIQWVLGPTRKTFMDGRYLSFPLAVEETKLLGILEATGDGQGWAQRLKDHGIDYAVTDYMQSYWNAVVKRRQTPEIAFFDRLFPPEEWALVFWDDVSMVFVRRIPRWALLIKEHEYRALKPFRTDRFTSPLVRTEEFAGALQTEIVRHRSEVDTSNIRRYIESLVPAEKI